MSNKFDKKYNCIEIQGSLLIPTFSIYLLEIVKENKKFYYVGMTGDRHYPSARSALHRLAGHIDKAKKSTQNQLDIGLRKIFGKTKDDDLSAEDLKNLNLKMYHWAMPGFQKWKGSLKEFNEASKKSKEYIEYKKIQETVLKLENKIIYKVKQRVKDNSLNETDGVDETILPEYEFIFEEVMNIIEQKTS